ncbi:hypothetical protein RYA05_04685 [Pseudomonas syringae pv. actinidiae]|nr:hypothetical protein [Pseudomonas syringae pv. actinidiae]
MALSIRFEWRVLGDKGELEMPREEGPEYDRVEINNDYQSSDGYGFASREAAIARLEFWISNYGGREYVLLELFSNAK